MGNFLDETGKRNAIFLRINGKKLPPSQFKPAIHFIQIQVHIARICDSKSGELLWMVAALSWNKVQFRQKMNGGNILIMASKE